MPTIADLVLTQSMKSELVLMISEAMNSFLKPISEQIEMLNKKLDDNERTLTSEVVTLKSDVKRELDVTSQTTDTFLNSVQVKFETFADVFAELTSKIASLNDKIDDLPNKGN